MIEGRVETRVKVTWWSYSLCKSVGSGVFIVAVVDVLNVLVSCFTFVTFR